MGQPIMGNQCVNGSIEVWFAEILFVQLMLVDFHSSHISGTVMMMMMTMMMMMMMMMEFGTW